MNKPHPHLGISCRKNPLRALIDTLAFPLRAIISDQANERIGLTSLRHERCAFVARHCRGKVLDLGCGTNKLAAILPHVIGLDVYPWPEIDLLADTTALPFADATFETVTLVACLNHITPRPQVLAECHRVLVPDGRILVTMISPLIGHVSHRLNWWDPDQRERGMGAEELYGMRTAHVARLLADAGFRGFQQRRFLYGLNNLYIARK